MIFVNYTTKGLYDERVFIELKLHAMQITFVEKVITFIDCSAVM